MIRHLRIKFVCVVMAIVMLMLAGILGVVIHFTAKNMEMQSISQMQAVAANPGQKRRPGAPPDEVRLPFFTVEVGKRGELIRTGGDDFDLSDEEDVLEIVNAALAANEKTGELEAYHLRYLKSKSPVGCTLVFSDTTTEYATLQSLLLSCLFIFFAASAAFLGISILLSQWTVRPVETAWDQQRQFVADASHELKTPLSVIMANAELMQAEDTGAGDCRKYAENIMDMSYQMRTLVENMLEMARVDNGAVNMQFASVDFSQLVTDAVLSVQLLYEEQEMGLNCEIPEGIFVNGSEQHLYQVLDVLLDNALKYSSPRGIVNVSLAANGRSCILTVGNPGAPIPKEELKKIFKRFYRADKARTMNGSYGLGLAIAESVVTAHKGKIWAESEGGYNTFRVQLPILHV